MKRAIILDAENRMFSSLVGRDTVLALEVGMRTECLRDVDFSPYSVVLKGSTGIIVLSDPDTGEVEIQLDQFYPGLRAWGNSLVLMPFDSDAILDAFKAFPMSKVSHAA